MMAFFRSINRYSKLFRYFVIALIAVSALIGIKTAIQRVVFDKANQVVELVMSYSDIVQLAKLGGIDQRTLLTKLNREFGLTTIAVEEDTISSLVDAGKLTILKGSDINNMLRVGRVYRYILTNIAKKIEIRPDYYYFVVDETGIYSRVKSYLSEELGESSVQEIGWNALEVRGDLDYILSIGLGVSSDLASELSGYQYQLIPRLKNSYFLTSELVKLKLESLKQDGVTYHSIIFDGDSVLGYPTRLTMVYDQLAQQNIQFGYIEFAKQLGAHSLSTLFGTEVVRIHSIPVDDLQIMSFDRAVNRYIRSAKERHARVLFLHPFFHYLGESDLLTHNYRFLSTIRARLEAMGFTIAPVKEVPFSQLSSISWLEQLVVSLGAVSVFLIGLCLFIKPSSLWLWGMIGVTGGGYYLSVLFSLEAAWNQFIALIAAISFPIVAIISCFPDENLADRLSFRLFRSIQFIGVGVCWSLLGALIVQAALYGPDYILGISHFYGVKVAILIPLIVVSIYFYLEPHRLSSFFYVFKRMLIVPIQTISLVVIVLSISFVSLYLLRSGNYISFQIPIVEVSIREFLEQVLFVRPRTKEFLIGYPFLMIAIVFGDRALLRDRLWFLLGIGVVAFVSLINSFCHIHTPVLISLYRSFLGVLLGVGIGISSVICVLGVQWLYRKIT